MERPPLLLVGPLPPPNDGQSLAFGALAVAARTRYDAQVIDISDVPSPGRSASGTFRRMRRYSRLLPAYLRRAAASFCRIYITLAQSPGGFARDFVLIWIASALGRPIIGHLHGGNYDGFYSNRSRLFRFTIRATLARVDRILVLGKDLVRMFDFAPCIRDRVFVVENGLPFADPAVPPKSFAPDEHLELLFLSNLVESKGYFDVLAATAELKRRGVDVRCHFAGEFRTSDDDRMVHSTAHAAELFRARIRDLSLESAVIAHGMVVGSAKELLLRSCHILVLPTNYVNEGQPLAIIEALAFGMPTVTTKYRAIPDLITDGVTGVFVEYGRPELIANAVERIFSKACFRRMSEACLAHYRARFTWDAHLSRLRPHLEG